MSGAPKRSHDDGAHSTPVKRPHEETGMFASPSGRLMPPLGTDFQLPFEHGQDGRLSKVQRVEFRDDKRSPLLHRMPLTSSNFTEQPFKEPRDAKIENWEFRAENREIHADSRLDPQASKVENDVRIDSRVDGKEPRPDRSAQFDYKGDIKSEKDGYSTTSSYISWKDSKEHHGRGKRYFEPPSDGFESWRLARSGLQGTDEVAKDLPAVEERCPAEAHEAVGENRVDLKNEEKFRDKDRRRKDERNRDFGERDKDKNDRRVNMQLSGISAERKELQREDRDVDWPEKERKDSTKDKEGNEREKDHVKKESSNVNEKENLHIEKDSVDVTAKNLEQENAPSEPKRLKDDNWKADKDSKEKKRERDADLGVRHDQRSKYIERESDDGCAEGDTEKDKEVFGGVQQQRRRMLRSRGTPQAPHREPRKIEVSAIVYKAGECMQELLKSWKEFEASQDAKNGETLQSGPTLEIRIPAEYVTSTNRQVKGAQLWGTDIYTNDSDLYSCTPVTAAQHHLHHLLPFKNYGQQFEFCLHKIVTLQHYGTMSGRVLGGQKGGGTIDLEPRLNHTSAVEPTLAPVTVERTMTTRAAASNALRQQRFVREVTIQYNLCNEPWLKYSISIVADKGLKKPLYTSARLKKGEVLYLETHFNRYELCSTGDKVIHSGAVHNSSQTGDSVHEKIQNHSSYTQNGDKIATDRENIVDVFRWSRCKKAMPEQIMRSIGIPLPMEHLEVLEENLEWEDVQWSQTGVWVAGKEYALARVHFLAPN
ncbi:hypothetical protein ACMD2_02705 [Ananas comosus]|uniref:Zinc finger CCCH domain-containing protein 13 n=1 Tax=Ananas comosus TaxID=4615 RepID=A0A199VME4_ANACO|nr:hypothetical protein ACMD2_02705 [Ananas comosus]